MFSESEKPWIATDTLPWPPRHLRPYIEQDYTQDWEIVDDSIPDDLRKEFEEWYKTVFIEAVKLENERYERQLEQDRYDRIWHERVEAMWNHEDEKYINFDFEYCYTIGIVLPEIKLEDMSLNELKEYVNIVNVSHKNWLEVVKKQESIPGYLPDDFNEKNLELARKKYKFRDDVSFEEIMQAVENEIKETNLFLQNKIKAIGDET